MMSSDKEVHMRVCLKTPHNMGINAYRGIGSYAMHLREAFREHNDIKLSCKNANIIHYPYFDFFFHSLPLVKSARTVVTIHDVTPLVFPHEYPAGIRGTARFFLQKLSLMNVSAIITDSECSKRDIVEFLQIPEHRIYVTYLAGNPEITRQPNDVIQRVRKKYDLPEKYILYIGDMNYNKNLPTFIHAASYIPRDVSLVMVGRTLLNTNIQEGQAIQEALDEFNMRKRTHILTDVPQSPIEDLSAILSAAEVYVQPSLYEGFGLSVLDAMQAGTMVVSSQESSLKEVGGDAAYYVDPYSARDIAKGISEMLEQNATQIEAWKKKMERNVQRFNWNKTAERTLDVYRYALGQ